MQRPLRKAHSHFCSATSMLSGHYEESNAAKVMFSAYLAKELLTEVYKHSPLRA